MHSSWNVCNYSQDFNIKIYQQNNKEKNLVSEKGNTEKSILNVSIYYTRNLCRNFDDLLNAQKKYFYYHH